MLEAIRVIGKLFSKNITFEFDYQLMLSDVYLSNYVIVLMISIKF